MNLIIDQGNTITKVAVFSNNKIMGRFTYPDFDIEEMKKIKDQFEINYVILSTVRNTGEELEYILKENFPNVYNLKHGVELPFFIEYKTPNTLGADRIAAVAGAIAENETAPKIVIDAGTAITYDFVDNENCYKGGNIAPGIRLRFLSLHDYTGLLPLVEKEGEIPEFGDTTITAIRCGVVKGVVYEINGFIQEVRKKYPNVLIFLTGGDSFFLSKSIKYPNFVEENLVLKGLNRILNYNVEK